MHNGASKHTGHLLSAMRVIEWNRLRYERQFDYNLAVNLLLEETEELSTATSKVAMLDAIGDITFVAVGVLWKVGVPVERICRYMHDHNVAELGVREAFDYMVAVQADVCEMLPPSASSDTFVAVNLACHSMFCVALGALRSLGMQYCFYDVLKAICDSNDTKEVKGKTPANVKANVVKGAGFVPPTIALTRLISNHDELVRPNRGMKAQ